MYIYHTIVIKRSLDYSPEDSQQQTLTYNLKAIYSPQIPPPLIDQLNLFNCFQSKSKCIISPHSTNILYTTFIVSVKKKILFIKCLSPPTHPHTWIFKIVCVLILLLLLLFTSTRARSLHSRRRLSWRMKAMAITRPLEYSAPRVDLSLSLSISFFFF